MQEDFLYYVWKLQYFDKKSLTTCQGESLSISHPGTRNDHAGPDFLKGSVVINDVTWYGHIEMHINASDWYTHQHQTDKAYDNVILHVVWNHDKDIQQQDGTLMPTLVLKDRVAPQLHQQYQKIMHNDAAIPCAKQLPQVTDLLKASMLDKALFQRLTHKNNLVYRLLEDNKGGWEATAYQLLAYTFGFKVNSSTFLDLALNLPLKTLAQHADNLLQLEALLLGQANLLPTNKEEQDAYLETLKKEYNYLAYKYPLKVGKVQESQWKFFRLRPANFPTIRIAQFAKLLHQHPSIFDLLVNTPTKILYTKLAVVQSAYWQKHYRFKNQSKTKIPGLGKSSIEHILINTAVPLLVAYGKAKDEQDYVDRAIAILQHLPAEHNAIIRQWEDVGIKAESAFDSQALVELFNNFCTKKKCLSCHIGTSIMQKETSA
ncbi:MAG TPA: DUF2851 domain-containing protein [Amoebophilaceae bacterium]|nr:DUF2851 domain-containing protein [Amoebophilaceae bacterium]